MSDIQNEERVEKVEEQKSLKDALLPALLVWLKTLLYFIVLPYKIWKATTYRLADLSNKTLIGDEEEFPMYTFTKISYDATIFMFGFLAVIVSIIGLLAFGIAGLFSGIGFYFLIPLISFLKEVITITLGVIKRLESIDINTKK